MENMSTSRSSVSLFLADREQRPSRLLGQTSRIAWASTLKNNGLLWLMLNAVLPWDAYCAYRLQQCKVQIATRLPAWLDVWFELEAICSLATFAYLNPEYSLPLMCSFPQNKMITISSQGNSWDTLLFP